MKILMICLGNICRSPLSEGILRDKAKKKNLAVEIDSAGIGSWHKGEAPDIRAIKTAQKHGIDISLQRARQFTVKDFDVFDKLYVADAEVYASVLMLARNEQDKKKTDFLLNVLSPGKNKAVPDPYYGDDDDFENVFQIIDEACEKIIESIVKETLLSD